MGTAIERRASRRQAAQGEAQLIWRDESGLQRTWTGWVTDLSPAGMSVACPEPVPVCSVMIVLAAELSLAALSQVRHCTSRRGQHQTGVQFLTKAFIAPSYEAQLPDYHALLRAAACGEIDNIDRLYRTLAFRYHPDNRDTGDAEVFRHIRETYRILQVSRPQDPSADEIERGGTQAEPPRQTGLARSPVERTSGRLTVLALLYEKRFNDCQNATLARRDIECLTGLAPREVSFILWYLHEKGAVVAGDSLDYSISAAGVDLFDEAQLL